MDQAADPGDWVTAPAPQSPAGQSFEGTTTSANAKPLPDPGDWVTAPPPESTSKPPPRSTAADVGHGLGKGAIEGAGSILGLPSDIWHMLDRGYQFALTKGAEKMGLLTPEQGAALRQPIPGAEDYEAGSAKINEHLMNLARSAGADTSGPQTVPGQYAETVGSFLPAAAAMGASSAAEVPGAMVRYGLLPGTVSETAGQATKGTPLEPYARAAGAIGPEVALQGAGAATRFLNPTGRMLEGASDAQLADAQRILDESRAAHAPHTVPESVQLATGSGTRATDVQRVVEQSPRGAAIMRPFMAQRPGQTQALGQSMLDQISTQGEPFEVAPRIQAAADKVVGTAAADRTAQVDPYYQAAATDRVPTTDMNAFLDRIDNMIATDKTGIMGPELSKLRDTLTIRPASPGIPPGPGTWGTPPTPRVPVTDIENLDRARKFFRDRLALPQWAQDATSKEEGAKIWSLLGDLRSRMISASPDFAAGKNLYQNITETSFNPLVRSPTGQLAKAEQYPQQAAILFNPNPLPGSERAVGKAVRDVAASDPEAAAQLVRMNLERTFNEAMQNNLPGANQFGGPKFVAVVAGNSQQAKNLEAAVRALPNGDVRWTALRKGLDIMEGMGKRQPVGSQTEFNAQMNRWLQQGHPAGEFLADAASPGSWPSLIKGIYQRVMFERNTGNLARVFTEGSVDDLRQIAAAGKRSFQGQAAMVGALARQSEATQQQP